MIRVIQSIIGSKPNPSYEAGLMPRAELPSYETAETLRARRLLRESEIAHRLSSEGDRFDMGPRSRRRQRSVL